MDGANIYLTCSGISQFRLCRYPQLIYCVGFVSSHAQASKSAFKYGGSWTEDPHKINWSRQVDASSKYFADSLFPGSPSNSNAFKEGNTGYGDLQSAFEISQSFVLRPENER